MRSSRWYRLTVQDRTFVKYGEFQPNTASRASFGGIEICYYTPSATTTDDEYKFTIVAPLGDGNRMSGAAAEEDSVGGTDGDAPSCFTQTIRFTYEQLKALHERLPEDVRPYFPEQDAYVTGFSLIIL